MPPWVRYKHERPDTRSGRGGTKKKDRPAPWSQWEWDVNQQRWFRTRKDADGEIERDEQQQELADEPNVEVSQYTTKSQASIWHTPSARSSLSSSNFTSGTYPSYGSSTVEDATAQLGKLDVSKHNVPSQQAAHVVRWNKASEKLDLRYEKIKDGNKFFKVGKVFKIVWNEPAGDVDDDDVDSYFVTTKTGEKIYSKIRPFVVVRERHGCCICVPMTTHQGQGSMKPGIISEDYAAVYDNRKPAPQYHDGEEAHLVKVPIPIVVEDTDGLDPMSRINFGRIYTVEHNVRAMRVGRVPKAFIPLLKKYWKESVLGPDSDGESSWEIAKKSERAAVLSNAQMSRPPTTQMANLAGPHRPLQAPQESPIYSIYKTPSSQPSSSQGVNQSPTMQHSFSSWPGSQPSAIQFPGSGQQTFQPAIHPNQYQTTSYNQSYQPPSASHGSSQPNWFDQSSESHLQSVSYSNTFYGSGWPQTNSYADNEYPAEE